MQTIDEIGYRSLLFGFPFMTLGLVAGSVLAIEKYGPLFFYDPKILLSLHHVGGVHAAAVHPLEFGMARPPRGVSGDLRLRGGPGRMGRKLLQPRAQVYRLMNFIVIGVNHQTAPVEVREQFAIPEARLPEATKCLATYPGIEEGMIVSTCNRVELLARTVNGNADMRGFMRAVLRLRSCAVSPSICTNIASAMRCGTSSAWPPVSTRWSSASRRFSDR